MILLDILKHFLSGNDGKALIDSDVNVDNNSSRAQISGTGQTGKIKNNGGGSVYIDNSTTNNYNIINVLPGQQPDEAVRDLIRKQFNDGGLQFLYQPSDMDLVDYNKFEKESDQIDLADFFVDKISNDDLRYLRVGLYIKQLSVTDKKRAVEIKDKAVVGNRRARNIINMASAGYFENYIKPIFENSTNEEAVRAYKDIVEYLPEFIFVNNAMKVQDVIDEVSLKLEQKERYHLYVRQIIISGLGSCVSVVINAESELAKKYPDFNLSVEKKKTGQLQQAKLTIILNQHSSEDEDVDY